MLTRFEKPEAGGLMGLQSLGLAVTECGVPPLTCCRRVAQLMMDEFLVFLSVELGDKQFEGSIWIQFRSNWIIGRSERLLDKARGPDHALVPG